MKTRADKDKLIEQLLTPCSLSPEHEILARLLGTWQAEGRWYYVPGQEFIPVQTTMTNTAIYGGLYVQSDVSLGTDVASRSIVGFDPEEKHYTVVSFSSLVSRVDHEHGRYDSDSDALVFSGVERFPNSDIFIPYRRKFGFVNADIMVFELVYPDMKPGRQEGMIVRLERR